MNTRAACIVIFVAALVITACAPAIVVVTPTPGPPFSRHGYHATAYDIESDRIVVFGGQLDGDHALSDTWIYDIAANTWAKMSPAQSPVLVEGPMDYDSESDRTIFFAGNGDDAAQPVRIGRASQTWAYDCNTDTWADLHASGTPSGLLGARMVYDTQSDRMILFGGLDVPLPEDWDYYKWIYHNETWAYDFNTNTWTNMQPEVSPPGRNYFQIVYDSASDRVLVWGKNLLYDASGKEIWWGDDDVWAYDFETNTWTALKSALRPTILHYGAFAYVPALDRVFLFGGVTLEREVPFNEMWAYDDATQTWERVNVDSGPSARGWHTLTYSPKADRIVLIGGGRDRDNFTNEVWVFDPYQKTWTQVGPR